MPIGTYFVVGGVEKFVAAARLAPEITAREERQALRESLSIVRTLALGRIHHRGGKRRVALRTTVKGAGTSLEGRLHPTGVGNILEGGAKPHQEKPVHAMAMAFPAGGRPLGVGGVVYTKTVHHPGVSGKEFLKPAFEESKPLIQERFNAAANRLAAFLQKA